MGTTIEAPDAQTEQEAREALAEHDGTANGNGVDPGPEPGRDEERDEQRPDGAADDEPAGEVDQLVLEGTVEKLTSKVGGKAPTTSMLTITGGQIQVAGQYDKGDTVLIEIEAKVNHVAFKDEEDAKTGQIVGCVRQHKARIKGVRDVEIVDDGVH